MTSAFRGVIPPVVVPLTADQKLDVPSFERSINRMIDAGVDGLFFLGSSGEVAFSTDARREEILTEGVRIVAGRVPTLAGIIDMQPNRMVEHGKVAKEIGVDALVATAPFYALGGPANIERSFRVIRENVDLPLFAYDLPVCVHVKLDGGMLMRLGNEGVLAGVKDSSGDDVSFRMLCQMNKDAGHPLELLTGHEVVVDGAYLSGGDGSVPGLGNVAPEPYVKQWKAAQQGDWETVRAIQDDMAKLMRIAMVVKGVQGFGAGVGAFKTALQLLGVFETNTMPEPVITLEGENVDAVAAVLREAGMLA